MVTDEDYLYLIGQVGFRPFFTRGRTESQSPKRRLLSTLSVSQTIIKVRLECHCNRDK
jgi:hypothetical protein